ncbi:MAG: hypothetical protein K8Q97_03260 [Candidatus Andersenbacteria bacterium]|nr:hypothetical protein [Candidatus Andersenbacteria bacterium]
MHTQDFINEMKARLESEKALMLGELSEDSSFPDYGRNDEDNATEVENYQSMSAVTSAAKERLDEVEDALNRISAGTYGVTESGEMIPENRLRANPAATTLVV